MFSSILIQTNQRCTRTCKHCFYGQYKSFSNDNILSINTIYKILEELKCLDYKGRISFYANNEPLTDKRILNIILEAKKHLPNSYHFIQTNGDLLTDDLLEILANTLDGVQINVYSQDSLYYGKKSLYTNVKIADKTNVPTYQWSNKAGYLKGIGKTNNNNICLNPFHQMIISSSGLVPVCSSDAFLKYVAGDIHTQSLIEIWNSDFMMDYRQQMLNQKRYTIPLCSNCDCKTGNMMETRINPWKNIENL